jgi:beta-glucosidase
VPAHTPQQYPGVNGTAIYSEGLQVGYRWYDAKKIEPLFPFGFGLSYTTFAFDHLKVSRQDAKGNVTVTFNIRNTGQLEGANVAQLYVAAPQAAGEPPRQLKGFQKINLAPGERKQASLNLDSRAFSIWDTRSKEWKVISGQYEISVGDSSRNLPLHGAVEIH